MAADEGIDVFGMKAGFRNFVVKDRIVHRVAST